ncbi:hypothetical protein ES708_01001 [subsurface metagenome]|jgi:hypothetical protein
MTKTIEYSGANHKVSPATIELLISERNKGKSLRQVGQMFGRSGERVRKLLAREEAANIAALLKLSARADPVLAKIWDDERDAAYDRI